MGHERLSCFALMTDGSVSTANLGTGHVPRHGSDESDSTADVGTGHVPRDGSDGSDSTADVGTGHVPRGLANEPASAANVRTRCADRTYVLDQLSNELNMALIRKLFPLAHSQRRT